MGDGPAKPEDVAKSAEQMAAERTEAVKKALAELYKNHHLEDSQKAALMQRVMQVLNDRSGKAVNAGELRAVVEQSVNKFMREPASSNGFDTRRIKLDALGTALDALVVKRNELSQQVSDVLGLVEKRYPPFARVSAARKLQVMTELQASIGEIMKDPATSQDDKKKLLEQSIKDSLSRAASNGAAVLLPADIETAAKSMATTIIDGDKGADKILEKALADAFKGLEIGEGTRFTDMQQDIKTKAATEVNMQVSAMILAELKKLPATGPAGLPEPLKAGAAKELVPFVMEAIKNGDADIASSINNRTGTPIIVPDSVAQAIAAQVKTIRAAAKVTSDAELAALDKSEKAMKDNIKADVTARIWPEMMRQDVPDAVKVNTIKAIMADSITKNAAEEWGQTDINNLDKAYSTLEAYARADMNGINKPETRTFIVDNIKKAAHAEGFLSGYNAGLPTLGAVGITAALAVGTDIPLWQKLLAGVGLIGGAALYENRDALFKPSDTPKINGNGTPTMNA